jgi:cell division protein ZapA (FtsZ GTPase activity inhibitor)
VINIKKNESLAKLNLQYQTADKAKKTFGYIGIISLTLLVSVILLNDLAKLCNAIYNLWTEKRRESQRENSRRDKEENAEDEEEDKELQIQVERMYSKDLEMKLEQVHLKLVKAVAANKRK